MKICSMVCNFPMIRSGGISHGIVLLHSRLLRDAPDSQHQVNDFFIAVSSRIFAPLSGIRLNIKLSSQLWCPTSNQGRISDLIDIRSFPNATSCLFNLFSRYFSYSFVGSYYSAFLKLIYVCLYLNEGKFSVQSVQYFLPSLFILFKT